MRISHCRFPAACLLAVLVAVLVGGCGKYDGLERNMRYVSNDLLRQDAAQAWAQVREAHARWGSAGYGREKDDAAFAAYQDAYARYAIVYNELLDRQGRGPAAGRLRAATNELPPPPPGVAVSSPGDAPREPAASEPKTRELNDATAPATPDTAPRAAAIPASGTAGVAVSGERYVIRSGDSLRTIAKRHGVSEKSLMAANGLTDPDRLAAGKSLVIPAN